MDSKLNWEKIGLMVGLEIHQQLDTNKLFCNCSSDVVSDEGEKFFRRLHTTKSELGATDVAAAAAAERARTYRYVSPKKGSCLVERDEEPPHAPNAKAMEIALQISAMLGAEPVDEAHFMRKIVVDGSNTGGFQRTALIAMGGKADGVRIQTVCLEEDSCRKISDDAESVTYSLDRLGIPLVEIATAPDIRTPEQAKDVALAIGLLLRATGRVKRGLGTIRQDLNVSVKGGARVEIKGVQDLRSVPLMVEAEAARQLKLISVAAKLKERGASAGGEIVDTTGILAQSKSKVVASAISSGGKILVVKLPGFAGLIEKGEHGLRAPSAPGIDAGLCASSTAPRLGKELSAYAKVRAGVKGIFHSDELPGYGITDAEVAAVRQALSFNDGDAFVMVAEKERTARLALSAVIDRAKLALSGVPEEVRRALPDNTSEYMRPMPGAARMYPETDVPQIRISAEQFAKIKANLPESLDAKMKRFERQYELSAEVAMQIVRSGDFDRFEFLARAAQPAIAARLMLNIIPELESKGKDVSRISDDDLLAVFGALNEGKFAKEALPSIIAALADGKSAAEALGAVGGASTAELEKVINKIIAEKAEFVRQRGEAAIGPLMGLVMKEMRGKVDGAAINSALTRKVKEALAGK
ncbi:MAG: Glu-tRNA(Gln) amidotransferase GatDE subunit E [Thermoplasmata archaeon HGW-Thermoplasmata-2]|nr:MAG: Glu-tRNA(Gln) amidotransferase GatDE subunit E [Thermoplasmata archaeon HGW-Thermoplasmata-2]